MPHWIEYYYVNYAAVENPEQHLLWPPQKYRDLVDWNTTREKNQNLAAELLFCMDYFLEHSEALWFYRCADDAFLAVKNLVEYLDRLNMKYDARKEPVVFGNCLYVKSIWLMHYGITNETWAYLQGGAGYLLSRAAVEAARKCLTPGWVRTIRRPEDYDVSIGIFEALPFTARQATTPYFLGTSILNDHLELVKNGEIEKLPRCPGLSDVSKTYPQCREFVSPVKWIVAFHFDGRESNLSRKIDLMEMFLAQPVNVMWRMRYKDAELCYGTEIPNREY
jgi:hypothetical protein